MAKRLSYTKYKVRVEAITDFCVSANQDYELSSSDYVLSGKYLYILDTAQVLNMIKDGLISESMIENIKEFLQDKNELLEKYFGRNRLELAEVYDNYLNVKRFYRNMLLSSGGIVEKYAIPGSTIKGILKTGFLSYFLEEVKYKYQRTPRKKIKDVDLKLNTLSILNPAVYDATREFHNTKELYNAIISIQDVKKGINVYRLKRKADSQADDTQIEWERFEDEDVISSSENLFFKNIMCSDIFLNHGKALIKKVGRLHRKKNSSGEYQAFELVQKGSIFEGELKLANHLKEMPVSAFSFDYEDLDYEENLNIIDMCKIGLKKYSKNLIKAEKKYFKDKIAELNSSNRDFYERLYEMANSGNIIVKLGYGGIHSKSFMSFDSTNLLNDNFFPYTLNVEDCNNLPIGWVKLEIEEVKKS